MIILKNGDETERDGIYSFGGCQPTPKREIKVDGSLYWIPSFRWRIHIYLMYG
jgi:hypothetical protein